MLSLALFLFSLISLSSFGDAAGKKETTHMYISSSQFFNGAVLPASLNYGKKLTTPALHWSNHPSTVKSFVVLVEDLDNSNFVHWLVYNIPASVKEFKANQAIGPKLGVEGTNGYGTKGFGGFKGTGRHNINFKIVGLDIDKIPGAGAGATKDIINKAIKGHVVAKGEFTAFYVNDKET
eukprot:TRINITY_DN699_c0_g1_i1.p1 TRINITY_DN699_c0_g1~~TRINITY_DN699_c0_g1_i1.p1  ORF type:complete len:179 (+),score=13.81 TRINITY_DN699_c0_g1_i1:100-636(+)